MFDLKVLPVAMGLPATAAIACAALMFSRASLAAEPQTMKQTIANSDHVADHTDERADGRHDFDFLLGLWNVHNRRLEANNEWQEFPASNEMRFLLDGLCNMDTYEATFPNGKLIQGFALRCFNPKTQKWSIYWNDSVQCELQPPVIGGFKGDRGEFYGDDTFKGAAIRVRYVWLKLGPDSAQWEQAFSQDGGKSWETNWVMELKRASKKLP